MHFRKSSLPKVSNIHAISPCTNQYFYYLIRGWSFGRGWLLPSPPESGEPASPSSSPSPSLAAPHSHLQLLWAEVKDLVDQLNNLWLLSIAGVNVAKNKIFHEVPMHVENSTK